VVALALLLSRLYGPLTALANVRVDVMSAMVSFDRVFEVLDLQPMIREAPDAVPVPAGDRSDRVRARLVQLPVRGRRLVTVTGRRVAARARRADGSAARRLLPRRARQLVALVGHSGAGQVDDRQPGTAAVRRDQRHRARRRLDVRHATLASLRDTIGVVSQDAHLFHDTIRANLLYVRPEATDDELWAGAGGARIGRPDPVAARRPGHRRRRPRTTGSPAGRSSGWRSPACCSRRRAS
jgi:ATP-binding cassette subfamily B protein